MPFIPWSPGWLNTHESFSYTTLTKDKTRMTISIDTEKAFDKIQLPFITDKIDKEHLQMYWQTDSKVSCTRPRIEGEQKLKDCLTPQLPCWL